MVCWRVGEAASTTPSARHAGARRRTRQCWDQAWESPPLCSLGLSATSQQYFSLRTNQSPATSQQYSSLRTNQHQPSATSQPNRLINDWHQAHGESRRPPSFSLPPPTPSRRYGYTKIDWTDTDLQDFTYLLVCTIYIFI
jgi:hypothetical protein